MKVTYKDFLDVTEDMMWAGLAAQRAQELFDTWWTEEYEPSLCDDCKPITEEQLANWRAISDRLKRSK